MLTDNFKELGTEEFIEHEQNIQAERLSSMIFFDDLLIKIPLTAKINYVLRKQNGLTWLFLPGQLFLCFSTLYYSETYLR